MRLDEHGRWVSDDGAYLWDEAAQTWQPSSAVPPTSSSGGPARAQPAGTVGTVGTGPRDGGDARTAGLPDPAAAGPSAYPASGFGSGSGDMADDGRGAAAAGDVGGAGRGSPAVVRHEVRPG
ncbi:hypothetical protein ND748_16365, partial [Frankia sp. AiPs1]|nr:hypothetical protein [Frankia sp. AiPs1]